MTPEAIIMELEEKVVVNLAKVTNSKAGGKDSGGKP